MTVEANQEAARGANGERVSNPGKESACWPWLLGLGGAMGALWLLWRPFVLSDLVLTTGSISVSGLLLCAVARGPSRLLGRMRGMAALSPPRVSLNEVFWSWIGSFCGIALVAWLHQWFFSGLDLTLMIGSLGASAVLVYGAVRSPLAQPRNLMGGHIVSALIGVSCWKLLHQDPWLAQAMAVATAIAVMHLTRTLHPPGGATALIAVIGSDKIHALGYFYVLVPATLGPLILLVVGLLINNIPGTRRYPEVWR